MELLIIIGFMAALFFLYQKGPTLLSQHVFNRGGHRDGQLLVSQNKTIVSSAPNQVVSRAIVRTVSAASDVPWILPKLYLVYASDSSITFAFGTKIALVFQLVVTISPAQGGGSRVSYQFMDWMKANGVVARQKEMNKLVSDIESAIQSTDSRAVA